MTWATERLDEIKQPGAIAPPIVETLGLGLIDDWGPGWVRKTWTPEARFAQVDGSLFGGYIAALADQTLAFAAMTVIADDAWCRTTDLQVRFMKVGRGHPLLIEGRVLVATRRLITAEVDFRRPDGDLIAKAAGQQIILPKGDA